MWLLVMMTVLSLEPTVRVIYDPIAKFESQEQCEDTARTIAKHDTDSRVFCIKGRQ